MHERAFFPEASHAPDHERPSWWRFAILAIVLLAAAAIVHLTPIRRWLQDTDELHRAARSLGQWVYPATVFTVAILVSCGVPRLLFCAAGGMVLGFWPGLVLTQIGTLLGYYGAFLFIRWGGRSGTLHKIPKLGRLADLVQEQGVLGVILLRQLPLHGTLTNLCLGLSRVKHRHFLIGSAIGILTEAIPATLIGAGLVKPSMRDSIRYFVIAGVAVVAIWIAGSYFIRRLRRTSSGAIMVDEVTEAVGE
jgi:uncharacterized membrane protein YdjX (TVP38/TMEM64 family)